MCTQEMTRPIGKKECGRKKPKKRIILRQIFLPLILIALFLLMMQSVSAQQIFKQGDELDLKIQCIIDGTYCSAAATCNINVLYQNNSIFITNQPMTYHTSYFNYSLPSSSVVGNYKCTSTCCQGSYCGSNDCDFTINPSGNSNNISTVIFYIGILILLLFFLGFFIYSFVKFDNLLNRVGMMGLSYLMLIAISFVAWRMALDLLFNQSFIIEFMKMTFYILMFSALPLLLGGFAWYVIMLFKIKEIERLMGKGFSEEEAYHRAGRKRR